jgi:hypothetical protein
VPERREGLLDRPLLIGRQAVQRRPAFTLHAGNSRPASCVETGQCSKDPSFQRVVETFT